MKLLRFRVTKFRSVEDSGWIETDNVTALIGTNESGKTNILLPLWKLNPAKEGEIVPTADFPRKHYNDIRNMDSMPVFITAVFAVDDEIAQKLSRITKHSVDSLLNVHVSRRLDGKYEVRFPDAETPRTIASVVPVGILESAIAEIESMTVLKGEMELRKRVLAAIRQGLSSLVAISDAGVDAIARIVKSLEEVECDGAPVTGQLVPRFEKTVRDLRDLRSSVSVPHPNDVQAAVDLVLKSIPTFVYYSTYGNLDSEIYLPHVIANLSRNDLGAKELAKARTLRVLFEFVGLAPDEILELGRDFNDHSRQPTAQEVSSIAEKKKERSILLQSASASLTKRFRDWWKQGEYRFRFEADGNHFRIWVSDEKRPEEIELEGRSTGLQWFLSFYLVFLVEREDAHEDAILLLDEPGQSLHPLAQRDLSEFFESLSTDNQLLYTCHSPFLVDADRLDRARKVFVAADGTSVVSSDLRANDGDSGQRGASYAVHAAVGLSVAESLLLGCTPIVVEGPSDQHYLTAMKILLVSAGRLQPRREFVFPPAGGAKGVKAVVSVLGCREDELPVAVLDSDNAGREAARALRKGLYAGDPDLILMVEEFSPLVDAEVEDLIDADILINQLDRWQRGAEVSFRETYVPGAAIAPQIEAWAKSQEIQLPSPGWKVELARRVKRQLLTDGPASVSEDTLEIWLKLFLRFEQLEAGIERRLTQPLSGK